MQGRGGTFVRQMVLGSAIAMFVLTATLLQVLMDVQMPKIEGDELTRRLRAGLILGCPRDVPVVALTAHALRGDPERFLAAGRDTYLSKPFSDEDLDRLLDRVAQGRGASP